MGNVTGRKSQEMSAKPVRIVVLPGDGIEREVVAKAMSLADALRSAGHFVAEWEELEWGAERFLATGRAVPPNGFDRLRSFNAILAAAFGDPRVPDGEYMREILLGMGFQFDLFINLRPVRCLQESLNPLELIAAEDIDMVIVRENSEWLYCDSEELMRRGSPEGLALHETIVTRYDVERIVRAVRERTLERSAA
jgi:3-isopropylmalate dehydrogenase